MNRLSFGLKFSLVSAMFVIPMAVTNFYVVLGFYDQFISTRTELNAISEITTAIKTRRSILEYSNLNQIDRIPVFSADDLPSRVKSSFNVIDKGLKSLQPVSRKESEKQAFRKQLTSLTVALENIGAEAIPIDRYDKTELMLNNYMSFVALMGSQSGLSQDEDIVIRVISEFMLGTAHHNTIVLGQVRAAGTTAYRTGGRLSSETSMELEELSLELQKMGQTYKSEINDILSKDPRLVAVIGDLAKAVQNGYTEIISKVENDILFASSMKASWVPFYEYMGQKLEADFRVIDAMLAHVESELESRLIVKRVQMLSIVGVLFVVFIIIFYLYAGFYVSTRGTISGLTNIVDKVAAGNMTVSYAVSSKDELGELGGVFNGMIIKIHDLIQMVGETVIEVERQSERVQKVSSESNILVTGQRQQIELVANAMNEMSSATQEVSSSSATAVQSAKSVNDQTLSGREVVEQQVGSINQLAQEIEKSVNVINQLATDSAAISQVLDVIKGIAEQTNLLALNAAIEAARAGEQGRGFAVVADEVRTLAQRTQQSTEEIEQMIVKLQSGVGEAVKAMNASHTMADSTVSQSDKVQEALDNILSSVGMIVEQSQQIATAAERQTSVANDIDSNIVEINLAGEKTAEGANETEKSSRQLSSSVVKLKDLITNFEV
jgi:methyl-accepting chemotaxis protein